MIGIPLIVLWLYIDERSKKEQQQNKNFVSSKTSSHKQQHQHCTCPICEHRQAEVCMHEKCACCIIMKDGSVIGHSINPLQ
jgi:hypothetical protein